MESNIIRLDELVVLKKQKGHKANQTEKEDYLNNWLELATEEGFSEKVEEYFYKGFFYTGAASLKTFMDKSNNPNTVFIAFVKGKQFKSNREITFKILMNLLALYLKSDNSDKEIVHGIAMRLPEMSRNKENRLLGSANTIFIRFFVDELVDKTDFMPRDEVFGTTGYANKILASFEEIFATIDLKSLNDKQKNTLFKIEKWINPEKNTSNAVESVTTGVVEPKEDSNGEQASRKTIEEKHPTIADTTKANLAISNNTTEMPSETLIRLTKEMTVAANAMHLECDEYKRQIKALEKQLSDQKNQNADLEKDNKHLNDEISKLLERCTNLTEKNQEYSAEIANLKDEVVKQKEEIDQKNHEITDGQALIGVLDKDRSKQSEEFMSKLSRELRFNYEQYSDTDFTNVTPELGQFALDQLKEVFDILAKNGLELKK